MARPASLKMPTTTLIPEIWAIGDIQGCNSALTKLLQHPDVRANANAKFWFCGDLINRGPDSIAALNTIIGLQDRAVTVLGNHDLHFLGIVAGIRTAGKSDTLTELLNSPNLQEYVDWLRHKPLVHFEYNHLLVHAGVLPAWSVSTTLSLAQEVEGALRSPDWQHNIQEMYGNAPYQWSNTLTGSGRLRIIINALTRMRMCDANGYLDFEHKGEPESNENKMPWFEVKNRQAQDQTIVFGHWSALGLLLRPNLIGLDTGCVWGRQLTAVRLSDRKVVQVACSNC